MDEVEAVKGVLALQSLGDWWQLSAWSRFIASRNSAAVWLMGHGGLRLGELLGLVVGDVFVGGEPVHTLVVRPEVGKGGRSREIPLDRLTREAIRRLVGIGGAMSWEPMRALICRSLVDACTMSPRGLQVIVARIGFLACQRLVTPHMLRHTYAARLRRRVDLPVVQALLGHACLSSTQVYMGVTADDMRGAVDGLSGGGNGSRR